MGGLTSKTPEPMSAPKLAADAQCKLQTDGHSPFRSQQKSWRSVLGEVPLDPKAKPFKPQGLHAASVGCPVFDPQLMPAAGGWPKEVGPPRVYTDAAVAMVEEDQPPEWMQYLVKKLDSQAQKPASGDLHVPSKPRAGRAPADVTEKRGRFERSQAGRPPGGGGHKFSFGGGVATLGASTSCRGGDGGFGGGGGGAGGIGGGGGGGVIGDGIGDGGDGDAGGSGFIIHTQEYLRLLKEGDPKTKSQAAAARRAARKISGTAITKPMGTFSCASLDTTLGGLVPGDAASPFTASAFMKGLRAGDQSPLHPQLSATTGSSGEAGVGGKDGNPVAQAGLVKRAQDDIDIENLAADHDMSQLTYWSEDEFLSAAPARQSLKDRPSAHVFDATLGGAKIRSYVMQDLAEELDRAVAMLLLRLQIFTERGRSFAPYVPAPRRFIIGLKEVARRAKQSKVTCLIVAPDIEGDANNGGLDDRMRELLALAYQNNIPVIFALSRARLGKSLGKAVHVSVLGVLDARGARGHLNEAVQLAEKAQQSWLARVPVLPPVKTPPPPPTLAVAGRCGQTSAVAEAPQPTTTARAPWDGRRRGAAAAGGGGGWRAG